MFIHNLDPVLFSVGGLQIRYYGLFYAIAAYITYFLLPKFSKLSKKEAGDAVLYLLIGTIIGARIFYVFAYNFSYYSNNLLEIFFVWQGGLSFHGGLTGAFIAGLLYCRKTNVRFYHLADGIVIPLSLGLALGRIGNFINGELVGRMTTMPWGVKFQGYDEYRHPSQLYAVIKDISLALILYVIHEKKRLKEGTLFWLFVSLYSAFRFIVGFFRAPDPQIGYIFANITLGQIFSVIFGIIGIMMMIKNEK